MLTKEPNAVKHFCMRCWANGAQHKHFLNAHSLVGLQKANAVFGGAYTERSALLHDFTWREFAGVRSTGQTLVAGIIALIIRWYSRWIIIPPDQPRPFALLFKIPVYQLRATPRDYRGIFVAVPGGH